MLLWFKLVSIVFKQWVKTVKGAASVLFFDNMDGRGLRQMRVKNRCRGMSRLDEACKKIFPSMVCKRGC